MNNLVKVEGEVVVKDGTGRAIQFYETEFVIDGSVDTIEKARSLVRKGLITEKLRKEVEFFKSVRTCQVVSLTTTNKKSQQSDLDKVLIKAIELGCVPENIDIYKNPEDKVKALNKAVDGHNKRKKKAQADTQKEIAEELVD